MTPSQGWRYGLLGLPLAFAALPLYVQLPAHYAQTFGAPLGALGAVLLGARLLDAVLDPWIGRAVDRLFGHSPGAVLAAGAFAAAALALGFVLLFFPPVREPGALLAWAAFALLLTYLGYSTLSVAHQAWGAMLSGDEAQRARIVGWREALGLAGVVVASVLPALAGWAASAAVLVLALVAGCIGWARSPAPASAAGGDPAGWWAPFAHAEFRALLAVFVLNGIATAVPATLLLFFVRDRLQLGAAWEAGFLASYFLAGAASIPLWLWLVRRIGLARAWLAGMLLCIAVFAGAATLSAGDAAGFLAVCLLCGLALGSDLALPAALLAGVIQRAGALGRGEGLFFGWWNFATKLNLALAAGLALPLLALAGYAPGTRDAQALTALTLAYCLLPCALKAAAAAVLYARCIRHGGFR